MTAFSMFRTYQDPLEAEALLEILEQNHIPFERSFENSAQSDDYVGSNPFDTDIVIKIEKRHYSQVEALLKRQSD